MRLIPVKPKPEKRREENPPENEYREQEHTQSGKAFKVLGKIKAKIGRKLSGGCILIDFLTSLHLETAFMGNKME